MATKKTDGKTAGSDGEINTPQKKTSTKASLKKTAIPNSEPQESSSLSKFHIVGVPGAMYGVEYESQPLLTSLGGKHPVQHSSIRFLEHLVLELCERGDLVVRDGVVVAPLDFDSYSLLGLQREWIASERDTFSECLVGELVHDGMLRRPPIDVYIQQVGHYQPAKDWLTILGARLVDLDFVDLENVDGIPEELLLHNAGMGDEETEDFRVLTQVLTSVFIQMSPQQRAAAVYLNNITGSSAVYSLCLAAGGCTAQEYGAGVVARNTGGSSTRVFNAAAQKVEGAAIKALRFIELASGEIQRPSAETLIL
jgi:hypothetical protein